MARRITSRGWVVPVDLALQPVLPEKSCLFLAVPRRAKPNQIAVDFRFSEPVFRWEDERPKPRRTWRQKLLRQPPDPLPPLRLAYLVLKHGAGTPIAYWKLDITLQGESFEMRMPVLPPDMSSNLHDAPDLESERRRNSEVARDIDHPQDEYEDRDDPPRYETIDPESYRRWYLHERCDVPPPGWHCTRPKGHGGPCAAVPVAQDQPMGTEQENDPT